jgi:UDP-hydrolysing UDP-N-acetyl-D-glucosamine 2-epimerase
MRQTIAVVTTSRADYSHLYWPLKEFDLKLIVLASHLSHEFGNTVCEIEKDGFPIAARLECLLSSDSDVGMAKSIGIAVLSLADCLGAVRPDVLLLIADRYEMLAPAAVALALRIPIAHIEGGEISRGAIDDAVRNALTKMSHIHFTSTDAAKERVISMGEEPWRVHRAGAPSLDHLRRTRLLEKAELEKKLQINLEPPTAIVAYHPVTLLSDTNAEVEELFTALAQFSHQLIFCHPNADVGGRSLADRIQSLLTKRGSGHFFINLPPIEYWSLLQYADLMVGNSSSGIMESASFALPTIDVGMRQEGRERARNVLDAEPLAASVLQQLRKAESRSFRESLSGRTNPYGDGRAAERIVQVLTTLPARDRLLLKRDREAPPEPCHHSAANL